METIRKDLLSVKKDLSRTDMAPPTNDLDKIYNSLKSRLIWQSIISLHIKIHSDAFVKFVVTKAVRDNTAQTAVKFLKEKSEKAISNFDNRFRSK